jgi:carboxyl-terminal processing protease
MASEKKIQSWLPLLLSIVLIIGMFGGFRLYKAMEWRDRPLAGGGTSSIQQALDLIKLKYVDSIALDSIEYAGLQAITNRLDPHSVFIPAASIADVEADLSGNFSGIGVEYQMVKDTMVVVYVIERGPAEKAGLQIGDAIISVNDSTIAGKNIENAQLRALLRGKRSSTVDVTLKRNGKLLTKTITRGEVPLPSADAGYMIDSITGYIRLNRFAETTFFEFMDAATALNKKGMKKMILDLRGNGGGLLDEATKIADELLEDGLTIVSTKGDKIKSQTVLATKPGLFEKGELIVLIDEQSASASEVLAGALQDNDRATIMGRRSFGKGLVQEQYNLSNGGALRLTVARYFTPLGRGIQKPYTNGTAAYKQEIMNRFHNGGTSQQTDTLDKKAFVTRKGKRLFESGGISPDIWVPVDTARFSAALAKLYSRNMLSEIVFNVYLNYKDSIARYPNLLSFHDGFKIDDNIWQQLSAQYAIDSIDLGTIKGKDRENLELRVKALLARYKWRNNGYFELLNYYDPLVVKALEALKPQNKAIL